MLVKIIVLLFTVYQVLAVQPFVEEGLRAKIFELTDNEVPTFRVTIPEEQLVELKEAVQVPFNGNDDSIERIIKTLKGEKLEPKRVELKEFKTKNATLEVEVNGEIKSFKKVTFSVGGNSSRYMARQGYNIKLRNGKELYGRSHFKLRSDAHDATYLRSKLACDIHNRLGLDSGSASYAILYINDEYFGLHVLLDTLKLSWVEKKYDDEDTANLYNCSSGGCFMNENCSRSCENLNDEVTDISEFVEFLKTLDQASSIEEIEKVFDVDNFLYETAYEYLAGGWDHLYHPGHNIILYKQKNGIWKMIYYDFDNDFGQDVIGMEYGKVETNPNKDYVNYTFDEWMNRPLHISDILVYKNQERFINIMNKFVTEAFNPALLFPHIDELKELIRPYIKYDKTPDENGINHGVINLVNPIEYSYEQWEANSEFTTIAKKELKGSAYGLKYWILARYRKVCETFGLECDPVYMDKNYQFPIVEEMLGEIDIHKFDGVDFSPFRGGNPFYQRDSNDTYSYTITPLKSSQNPSPVAIEEEPTETETPIEEEEPTETETLIEKEEPTEIDLPIEEPIQIPSPKYKCFSEVIGYPCCPEIIDTVLEEDSYGKWGYDFSKKNWCGLTPYEERPGDENCWSENLGYPCCIGCNVIETDGDGQWGYEGDHWCGIPSYCSE